MQKIAMLLSVRTPSMLGHIINGEYTVADFNNIVTDMVAREYNVPLEIVLDEG